MVGVPTSSVDAVIAAMRNAVVRGKQVTVRRYSEQPRERDERPFRGGPTSWRPERGAGDRPERPARSFGDKPNRSFGGDQPKRTFSGKPGGRPSGRPRTGGKGR